MAEEENQIEMKDEAASLAPFDQSVKESVEQLAEKTESLSGHVTRLKKKKKKKPLHTDLPDDVKEVAIEEGEEREWTHLDYKYQELLDRVFCSLREHNPELAGDR